MCIVSRVSSCGVLLLLLVLCGLSSVVHAAEGGAEASSFWLILAGEGIWGAILMGVLGVVWQIIRPYLDEWAAKRKLDKLFLAVETGVTGCKALYTDEMKKANADGKLTVDEIAFVRQQCRNYITAFMAQQGVDALKTYGATIIDMLCEWMLARIKNEAVAGVAKAVIPPLPDLAISAPSAAG